MGASMGASHAAAPHVYGGVPYGAAAPYGGFAPAYGHAAVAGSVPGGGGATSLEVPCRGSEGRVIGKGGEMINYIQSTTGAKLDMKRDVGTVLVSGTADAVAKAQGLVLEVIQDGDTRDKGGLVPGAYAAAAGGEIPGAAPGMAAGGMAPMMVAVPMVAPPGAYYAAPHAAAGGYQLQHAYGAAPAAAPACGAPQQAQAQTSSRVPRGGGAGRRRRGVGPGGAAAAAAGGAGAAAAGAAADGRVADALLGGTRVLLQRHHWGDALGVKTDVLSYLRRYVFSYRTCVL